MPPPHWAGSRTRPGDFYPACTPTVEGIEQGRSFSRPSKGLASYVPRAPTQELPLWKNASCVSPYHEVSKASSTPIIILHWMQLDLGQWPVSYMNQRVHSRPFLYLESGKTQRPSPSQARMTVPDGIFSDRERMIITWILIVLLIFLAVIGLYQQFVLERPDKKCGPLLIRIISIIALGGAYLMYRAQHHRRREDPAALALAARRWLVEVSTLRTTCQPCPFFSMT